MAERMITRLIYRIKLKKWWRKKKNKNKQNKKEACNVKADAFMSV